jgi:flagellar basal-body rod protein FlgF
MSKGFWPAISGAVAQSERMETIANNLANSDTTAFKRDQVAFQTVLSSATAAAQKEDIPRKPYTEKDFHRLDGRDTAYVQVQGSYTDHTQGREKITNSPLDVALEGKGFLEVLGPQGVRFTRQGSLKMNAEGSLVTTEGFPVLSPGGPADPTKVPTREESAQRAIKLDTTKDPKITITSDGKLYQGKQEVAQLSVVEFVDPSLLTKEGSSLFANDLTANVSQSESTTLVKQGVLETSNVNAIMEMSELLKATRLFEANEKIVKTYGDLEGRAVNDLGKL